MFDKYIGIDYSGAGEPRSPNKSIAVASTEMSKPAIILSNTMPVHRLSINSRLSNNSGTIWSREDIYLFLRNEFVSSKQRIIVGIDHGFSYPRSIMKSLNLSTWNDFLKWFNTNWKTTKHAVEYCKKQNHFISSTERRLVEKEFAPTCKGVVDLDRVEGRQGTVSYSTHAGLSWVYRLRRLQHLKVINLHFWPFDGPLVDESCHVIFEGYPALYKKRVALDPSLNEHERDAFAVAAWLRDRDQNNTLQHYLSLPTLSESELRLSELEGWILGCL